MLTVFFLGCGGPSLKELKTKVAIKAQVVKAEGGRGPAQGMVQTVYYDFWYRGSITNISEDTLEGVVVACIHPHPSDEQREEAKAEDKSALLTFDIGRLEPGETIEFKELVYEGAKEQQQIVFISTGETFTWLEEASLAETP